MILMNDKISESHEEKRIAVHLLPIACSFQRHCLGAFFLFSIRFIAFVFIADLKVPLLNANREPSMIFFKKIPHQCPYLCKITKVSFARSPSVSFQPPDVLKICIMHSGHPSTTPAFQISPSYLQDLDRRPKLGVIPPVALGLTCSSATLRQEIIDDYSG